MNIRQDQCELADLRAGPGEASHINGSNSSLNFDIEAAVLSRYAGQMGRGEMGHSSHGHLFDNHINSMSPDTQHK
jgi:hypothetical protein